MFVCGGTFILNGRAVHENRVKFCEVLRINALIKKFGDIDTVNTAFDQFVLTSGCLDVDIDLVMCLVYIDVVKMGLMPLSRTEPSGLTPGAEPVPMSPSWNV